MRNPTSKLLQLLHKSKKWQRRHNFPTWCHRQFFDLILFLVSSLDNGRSSMSISSLVLELQRFSFIRNTPVWVLPDTWGLGRVMDTKFGTNVSNEMLLNAEKSQGYSFYRFWLLGWAKKGGRGGGGTKRVLLLVISPLMKLINRYNNNTERFWWQQCESLLSSICYYQHKKYLPSDSWYVQNTYHLIGSTMWYGMLCS